MRQTLDDDLALRAGQTTVPIVEEEAHIEKRQVESDRVRVSTHTDLVEEHLRETLRTDEVEVMRVPVNRTLEPGEAAPTIRTEGNVTIVPVLEEIAVVEKRLLLREELHILRDTTTETVEVPVTLRKQRAVVDRTAGDGLPVQGSEGA
ncbi:YsnF/AvaK domain-containing protein [uncultured Enterovirga sp.]|uniref:YsnF/AvaK domain-containing protein n=1 Tax=uncultured Enterovirga sp. TaxID=2026352 RepID=UPI0035CB1AFB